MEKKRGIQRGVGSGKTRVSLPSMKEVYAEIF